MYKQLDPNFAYRVFTGGPLITIFTKNEKDIPDGMTAAWSCPYDPDVLLLVLDKDHTTSENIRHNGKLVVAIPSADQKDIALTLGSVHGRDVGNKLQIKRIDTELSKSFEYPVIKDALAYFECVCEDAALFAEKGICLAKVKNVYVLEEMWDDANEHFVPGCTHTLQHVSAGNFKTGGKVI